MPRASGLLRAAGELALLVIATQACSSPSSKSCPVAGLEDHKVGEPFRLGDGRTCTCDAFGDVSCGGGPHDAGGDAPSTGAGGSGASGAGGSGASGAGGSGGSGGAGGTGGSGGAAGACALATTYMFHDDGGLRASSDESTLTPAATHTIDRTSFVADAKLSCARVLPCTSPTAVTVPAIEAAVADPDVQSALAKPPGMLYGGDPRPVDGTVWVFQRADGKGFMVGTGAVPAGLGALETLMRKLTDETLAAPECAALAH